MIIAIQTQQRHVTTQLRQVAEYNMPRLRRCNLTLLIYNTFEDRKSTSIYIFIQVIYVAKYSSLTTL